MDAKTEEEKAEITIRRQVGTREAMARPDVKQNHSAAQSGLKHSEERNAAQSIRMQGNTRSLGFVHPPEFGKAISERNQGHEVAETTREKLAVTTAKMHENAVPGHAGMLGKSHTPETRETMQRVWSDPARRTAQSALMRASWARRKAEREAFSSSLFDSVNKEESNG